MASSKDKFSFKRALSELPRGEPLSTAVLREHGVSEFRASALGRSGWLTHLGRGVYMLPGDTLTREGCLAYLGQHVPGIHVGGKTALAWGGYPAERQFPGSPVPMGQPIEAAALMVHATLPCSLSSDPAVRCRSSERVRISTSPERTSGNPSLVRLAELLGRDLDLPWAATAKRHSQRIGGGKRWVAVAKTGERLDLRRS